MIVPGYNGRDRTFFFVDYEGRKFDRRRHHHWSISPPTSYRAGNFSSLST